MRERAKVLLEARIKVAYEALGLQMQAIHAAQEEGGWYGTASNLLSQSIASFGEATADYSDEIKKMDASSTFLIADFETGAFGNQAIGNENNFFLGAYTWADSPLELAVVPENGLAYKLGFRTGDTLVSVGADAPKDLSMLKIKLEASKGQKVEAVVVRDGKCERWGLSIPRDLPQSYYTIPKDRDSSTFGGRSASDA